MRASTNRVSFPEMPRNPPRVQVQAFPMPSTVWSSAFAILIALTALVFAGLPIVVHAETPSFDTPSGSPVPRWAMLRRSEVYARKGPSKDSRIVWTYRKASMPVQIISETRDWRLVCDVDGGVAWVSKTMLQNQKTVMVPNNGKKLELRASPDTGSKIKAYIRPRSLAQMDKCRKDWCKVTAGGISGWVPQASLWGTQTQAVCRRPDMFATR